MASGATLVAANGAKSLMDSGKMATTNITEESATFAGLDHDKRRKITLKCLELEEMLESQG